MGPPPHTFFVPPLGTSLQDSAIRRIRYTKAGHDLAIRPAVLNPKKPSKIGVPDSDWSMSPTSVSRSRGHRFRGCLWMVYLLILESLLEQTDNTHFGVQSFMPCPCIGVKNKETFDGDRLSVNVLTNAEPHECFLVTQSGILVSNMIFRRNNWAVSKKRRIFATTVPATPPNNAYHGGTSSFFICMKYDKQPTDITTQLSILRQRGLIVNDEDMALRQLASISYFRLASYWKPFETGDNAYMFASDTRLEEVVSLYTFDKELRSIIFTAIQDIEVALRTRIIHFFSLSHGAFWFMDASKFNNHDIFQKCLDSIQVELSRSKEDFLLEHFAKYDSPSMPPVWKTLEVVSFGNLSKLYANMKDVEVKKQVAKSMGLPQYTYLESWMRSLTVLRNCCAHHGRAWNRRYPAMPLLPRRLPQAWVDTQHIRPMKLYAQLCTLLYIEQHITPNSCIKDKLLHLLKAYPQANRRQMGFPRGWEDEPLWKV